jgi:hypothetical protein
LRKILLLRFRTPFSQNSWGTEGRKRVEAMNVWGRYDRTIPQLRIEHRTPSKAFEPKGFVALLAPCDSP